jgi:hypothetical protein
MARSSAVRARSSAARAIRAASKARREGIRAGVLRSSAVSQPNATDVRCSTTSAGGPRARVATSLSRNAAVPGSRHALAAPQTARYAARQHHLCGRGGVVVRPRATEDQRSGQHQHVPRQDTRRRAPTTVRRLWLVETRRGCAWRSGGRCISGIRPGSDRDDAERPKLRTRGETGQRRRGGYVGSGSCPAASWPAHS